MCITSLFQFQFAHYLKCWILDFSSYKMKYSLPKMNFRKYFEFQISMQLDEFASCLIVHVCVHSFIVHNGHSLSTKLMISSSCLGSYSMISLREFKSKTSLEENSTILRSLNLNGEEATASEEEICLILLTFSFSFPSLSYPLDLHCPFVQDLKHKSSSKEVFLPDSDYFGHGICIVVPGSSGIPKWIRNQKEGYQITIGLPWNWYENNDFLGIAICFVYAPLDEFEDIPENDFAHISENESGDKALNESDHLLEAESSISTELECQLSFDVRHGFYSVYVQDLSFSTTCKCYHDEGVSEQMWVIFYPKAAILESCHTNQFTFLGASFMDYRNHFKALKCGLQPIYAQDPIVQIEDVDASCLKCQRNVEHRKLCLKGQTINLLPIECASEFDSLCLRECKNLESLPTSIWEFKSLKSLFCSQCSQLQYFLEILENMENLRELHLNGTAIKERPSSIEHLNRLEVLNLDSCENLVTLPESICNLCFLKNLNVSHCSKLHKLPQNLGRLRSLKTLYAMGLNSTCCQLLSLSGLCSLKKLILYKSKLMQGVILSDICCLYSLEVLDLSFCNIDEGGIPTEICHLSSLQELLLTGNLFRSRPAGINQLSMLRLLDLGHCRELRQILALPSSLHFLDVHECTKLETSSGLLWSSLFKCFKSVIQDFECGIYSTKKGFARLGLILSVSSGIPKWISHQRKGAKVVAKLPQNWYKNNELLGFVLYSIYDPLGNESEERLENDGNYFKYLLTLRGHEIPLVEACRYDFRSCLCHYVEPKMWMIYYPKVAIDKRYRSNKWRQLMASFCGYLQGEAMKVDECGIHLIYAHDLEQNHGKAMIPTICQECQEDGNAINELPTIECPPKLYSLCLRECKNLVRLPVAYVSCSRLRSFPEILEDMENLRELHLDGTAIEELPSSIRYLRGLQYLNLTDCTNLVSLPESICNLSSLRTLDVSFCTELEKFPDNLRSLQCLKYLYASGTAIEELPSSFEHLQGLQCLKLARCDSLVSLPESFCNLSSLITLDVSFCTKLEKFPKNLGSLQRFKHLYEFECGSYWNEAIRIVISGNNGIPEWISQQKKGSKKKKISNTNPIFNTMDWYKQDDFLGFALYFVFIPMACDGLNCELNICGDQSECYHVDDVQFYCCPICGESSQMCVTYYPKVAIDNQYYLDTPVEVKECGYYLICTRDVINRNIPKDTSTDAQRSCDNTEATKRDHQTMIEYSDEQRSCDTRSAAEDTNSKAQTSYDCTQCTEHSDSPMDTTTQNIDSNVVDAQDDEEEHMHNWLELLCKYVQWICCRRY
ncbi:hypothetical protein PVL29_013567 [Vitis rotundifolia]|uniref:Uncharacterized protein n=1 Tax=Vitis rotundifolia TaxID=103349 RepID=A0AA38ZLS1_VITRO|nr:hypothetical protein PVL29_013567 [Vitis rotundifolia]